MPRLRLSLAAVGVVGFAGCVSGNADSTVVILQNQVPEDGCVIAGSPGDTYSSSGRIDVNSPTGYVLTPVAINNAEAVAGQETARMAFVHGARIDLSFPDPDVASRLADEPDTRIEVPFAARIDPGGGTTGMGFEALRTSIISQLSDGDLVYIDVKLFGDLGGSSFESQTWRFPVEVCDGCTVNDLGACSSLATGFMPTNTGNACNPFQDSQVDCCSGASGLVCPAVGTGTAAQ